MKSAPKEFHPTIYWGVSRSKNVFLHRIGFLWQEKRFYCFYAFVPPNSNAGKFLSAERLVPVFVLIFLIFKMITSREAKGIQTYFEQCSRGFDVLPGKTRQI